MRFACFALAATTAAALAGCGSGSASCTVDAIAQADGVGLTVTECGDFTLGSAAYTDAAMQAAQTCVLSAVGGGSAFRLSYDAADETRQVNGLRAAYTGVVTPAGLALRNYAGSGSGLGVLVSGRTCTMVTATPNCTPEVGVPCLSCAGDDLGAIVCRG
jgi:hypothetical protein